MNRPPFIFLDESGTPWSDKDQPLFAVGSIVVAETHELIRSLDSVLHKARQQYPQALPFEFKFSNVKRDTFLLHREFLVSAFKCGGFTIRVDLHRKNQGLAEGVDFHHWRQFSNLVERNVYEHLGEYRSGIAILDSINTPRGQVTLSEHVGLSPRVLNATAVESQGSSITQLIDLVLGATVMQCKIALSPDEGIHYNPLKTKLMTLLMQLLGSDSLLKDVYTDKMTGTVSFSVHYDDN